jgi:hypothetical protein
MALHPDFPQSPHAILDPAIRWVPRLDGPRWSVVCHCLEQAVLPVRLANQCGARNACAVNAPAVSAHRGHPPHALSWPRYLNLHPGRQATPPARPPAQARHGTACSKQWHTTLDARRQPGAPVPRHLCHEQPRFARRTHLLRRFKTPDSFTSLLCGGLRQDSATRRTVFPVFSSLPRRCRPNMGFDNSTRD